MFSKFTKSKDNSYFDLTMRLNNQNTFFNSMNNKSKLEDLSISQNYTYRNQSPCNYCSQNQTVESNYSNDIKTNLTLMEFQFNLNLLKHKIEKMTNLTKPEISKPNNYTNINQFNHKCKYCEKYFKFL